MVISGPPMIIKRIQFLTSGRRVVGLGPYLPFLGADGVFVSLCVFAAGFFSGSFGAGFSAFFGLIPKAP